MRRPCKNSSASASRVWARRLTLHDRWAVLDLETTGLHPEAEILEVAVISARGEKVLDRLVRPVGRCQRGAARTHSIGIAALASAPPFTEIYSELAQALAGHTIVAFHATYDRFVLTAACQAARLDPISASWECALERYALWRGFHASLDVACELEGIAVSIRHRAAADALLVWKLVQRMAGRDGSLTTESG